jgi:hypothetical protein
MNEPGCVPRKFYLQKQKASSVVATGSSFPTCGWNSPGCSLFIFNMGMKIQWCNWDSQAPTWPLKDFKSSFFLSPLFFQVLLYSDGLGKHVYKGPSQPCDFIKLPFEKRASMKEHAREKNCMHVLFLYKVWPQEELNQSDDKGEYEKSSWFGPKYAGSLCFWDQKQRKKINKGNVLCILCVLAIL